MTEKYIAPILGADSFNCPHCGALSHQNWLKTYSARFKRDDKPSVLEPDIIDKIEKNSKAEDENVKQLVRWARRTLLRRPFLYKHDNSGYAEVQLEGVNVSECYSCSELSIWLYDSILYPPVKYEVQPNPDLSAEVRLDFEEAALIVDKSPRGAAALLRLGMQKLIMDLGGKGNISDDIANLVKKGLPVTIQQALDIVRVIGNNAVHPGEIDLRDDRDTAIKLFGLINMIADVMVTQPKQIASMFGELPSGALEAIEKRDKPKGQ